MRTLLISALLVFCGQVHGVEIQGTTIQGGLIFGQAEPGSSISLDGDAIAISADGQFVIGFGRDETGSRKLVVKSPAGEVFEKDLNVQVREYAIERVDGLPPATVTPDPASLERIREDARMVTNARQRHHRSGQERDCEAEEISTGSFRLYHRMVKRKWRR